MENCNAIFPCSVCGENPSILSEDVGTIICCQNGCYEKYEGQVGKWFQTFPWRTVEDAIDEWNQAVKCNNGIKQLKIL